MIEEIPLKKLLFFIIEGARIRDTKCSFLEEDEKVDHAG
jgi:hypothetical protein